MYIYVVVPVFVNILACCVSHVYVWISITTTIGAILVVAQDKKEFGERS
jgi:hypothetical protein